MEVSEILGASDEDFLKMGVPETEPSTQTEEVTEPKVEQKVEEPITQEEVEASSEIGNSGEQSEGQPAATEEAVQAEPELDAEGNPVQKEETQVSDEPDYKILYEGLIKPLKANGKEIELKSHDELIQLAQQGANYTRKMQQLAPHRKTLMMLENNNLLDPEKLGFLIDLQRRDPAAIQKFMKEAEINPLEIDVDAASTYTGGKHTVTDAQANFQEVLDNARSSDSGMVVLRAIDSTWDQASKELVFSQPQIIDTMIQQQDSGIYPRIVNEMERQRILGRIPVGQSWLESYKAVGDYMVQSGAFNDLVAEHQQQGQTKQPVAASEPVATRVIAPKPQVTASDKAAAAAPSRTAAASARTVVNPLAVSDEDFMKQFENRL